MVKMESDALIYKNPKGLYQNFVNTFQLLEKKPLTKEEIKNKADLKWKEIKNDKNEVDKFLASAPKPTKKFNQLKIGGFFPSKEQARVNAQAQQDKSEDLITKPKSGASSSKSATSTTPDASSAFLERESLITAQENELCNVFLKDITGQALAEQILNDDHVWAEKLFSETTLSTARAWNVFFPLKQEYDANRMFLKTSKLFLSLKKIDEIIKSINGHFEEVLQIKTTSRIGITQLARNLQDKKEKMLEIVKTMIELSSLLSDRNLLRSLRRRVNQQKQVTTDKLHRKQSEMAKLFCMNSSALSWEDAMYPLIELQNGGEKFKMPAALLTVEEAISIGTLLEDTMAVSTEELRMYLPRRYRDKVENMEPLIKQLLMCFPLLLLTKGSEQYLVNMQQLDFNCSELDELFGVKHSEQESQEDLVGSLENANSGNEIKTQQKRGRSGGRPSVISKFPEIPTVATEFIKLNGYQAQERRRETTFQSCGVTIEEIRSHLFDTIPGLREHGLGLTTIRYLFQPVHKGTFAAERYKGITDGKVAFKDNSLMKQHVNGHYLLSRIKLRKEMFSHLDKEVTAVSCDTMNKLKVGTLAVSRYHQIRKIFLQSDRPNYPNHDFPLPYKLVPDGILILQKQENGKNTPVIPKDTSVTTVNDDLTVAKKLSLAQSLETSANFAAHQKRLDNNLLRSGLEIKDTPADGNCLFASIATELNINEHGVHKFSSSSVRDAVCNFLVDNADEYMQYFEEKQQGKKKEEFQQEINELRAPGVWKSQLMDLVLYAVSGLYNRTIILYTSLAAMPIFILQSGGSSCLDAEVLPLAYNACLGHEHYTPVQAVTDKNNEITVGQYEESLLQNNEQNDQASDCNETENLNAAENIILDRLGRKHLKYPHSGTLVTFIRNNIFHGSTSLEHINDLYPICVEAVNNGKGIFITFIDNGPDYNPSSYKNFFMYGRLWRKSNLDLFNTGSHASGQSASNDIEHCWSLLSRRLTCVTFSACDDGDTVPPCHNSRLGEEEKCAKEKKILENAANELCKYWAGASFDGFPVVPVPVANENRNDPFVSSDDVIKFLEAPIKDIRGGDHAEVLRELQFLVKHADRRQNELTFAKCQFFFQ